MAARLSLDMAMRNGSAAAAAATTAALHSLAKAQAHQHQQHNSMQGSMQADSMGVNMSLQSMNAAQGLHNLTSNLGASILSNGMCRQRSATYWLLLSHVKATLLCSSIQ